MSKDIRFECCGKIAPHKESRCTSCPEPDNRAEPGTPAPIDGGDIDIILDWAERDQDECRQCGDEEGERESLANLAMIGQARPLLLAAPELLEVAQQAEYWLEEQRLGRSLCEPKEILRVLRAVIAKATGNAGDSAEDADGLCTSCEADILGRPFDNCEQPDAHDHA